MVTLKLYEPFKIIVCCNIIYELVFLFAVYFSIVLELITNVLYQYTICWWPALPVREITARLRREPGDVSDVAGQSEDTTPVLSSIRPRSRLLDFRVNLETITQIVSGERVLLWMLIDWRPSELLIFEQAFLRFTRLRIVRSALYNRGTRFNFGLYWRVN